jgi:hypothetical protein
VPTDLTIKIDHVTVVPIIQKLPLFPLSLHRCHLTGHQTSVREPTAGAKTELGNEKTEKLSAKLNHSSISIRTSFSIIQCVYELGLSCYVALLHYCKAI